MSTISQEAASAQKDAIAAASEATSFFNSPAFHNHIRTWTFVILAIFLMGFLYVHESNANAAKNALADQITKQGETQQANIDKQISALHDDTKAQVQQLQVQITQVQTVAQAIASIKSNIPPVTITPIVTQPATATTPAVTTAPQQATGTTPVATIDGTDLKTLADNELACKQQTVELTSCQQEITLDQQKNQALTTEVTGLQKIKLEPAWKKTLKTIGQVALGIVIGRTKL
jgi:hypothetical protein